MVDPLQKNSYIAIDGVIGVGKTTLARLAQQQFDAEILLEVFEENPFLARFYEDRKRYAFQTQIFFLLSRYHQQQQAIPAALARGNLISDYTFDKNKVFARLNLEGDELSMYEKVQDIMATKIPLPDLVVYLRADTRVLMERITFRDRSYERTMERDYIAALSEAYDAFFSHYTQARVLTIETNDLDIVHRPADLERVIQLIDLEVKRLNYQEPLFGANA
jgi:deoxyguanosine kinase